jgi:hypothetical protein
LFVDIGGIVDHHCLNFVIIIDLFYEICKWNFVLQDLHRTGCSGVSGDENEEDRASLKRVLLGFARWNKSIGYCQGFNIIAALLLNVTERREDDALKVISMKLTFS